MIIHKVKQGSNLWSLLRAGIPTASELGNLITPKWEIRTGKMPATYLAEKVAEHWQGGPLPGFTAFATDQGAIMESEARNWINFELNTDVERVGFITADDGRFGCSPDGLLGADGGLELKCPEAHTHASYLLDGDVPDKYTAQVHGCMYVTGRPWWMFVSYRRHFPTLAIKIMRDEKIQKTIHEAVLGFQELFDNAIRKMEQINGGPSPNRLEKPTPEEEAQEGEEEPEEPVTAGGFQDPDDFKM
jgi:hypothetical protein